MTEIFILGNVTPVLLIVALGIFVFLAIQSKNVKSFQFQIAVILIIWIAGEIVDVFGKMDILKISNFEPLPSIIHMIAMILIGVVFWARFYYSKRRGRTLSEDLYE